MHLYSLFSFNLPFYEHKKRPSYIENLINGMKNKKSIEYKSPGDTFVITVERKKIVDPLECRPLKIHTVNSSTDYHQNI